jgi:ubiquinone/menaquinone biosynthesis C-methylase UbiE
MSQAERFTGRVAEYERYRLRYPAEVLEMLREHCGLLDTDAVADVGAGTGMLAELFLENGNRVIAVEPNAEMRAVCERLRRRYAGLTVVDAMAEATTLDDASVDFVTVGRAWHWFDQARAVVEFRRILKPGGWVTIVSNRRDRDGSAMMKAYEGILKRFGRDYSELQQQTREPEEIAPLFEAAAVVRQSFHGEQMLTLEELVGQTQSYSVAPQPGDAKYEEMQRGLREFFAEFAVEGLVRMKTVCSVMACRLLAS